MDSQTNGMRRRMFLQHAGAWGLLAALGHFSTGLRPLRCQKGGAAGASSRRRDGRACL